MKAEEFWRCVSRGDGDDACWLWMRARDKEGYGLVWFDGKNMRASHVAWKLTHGAFPCGKLVLHTCDNPPCLRPGHLFLGTTFDNIADKLRKGRQPRGASHPLRLHPEFAARGDRHGMAKLTAHTVMEMRRLHKQDGMMWTELGVKFGFDRSTVRDAVLGKTWKHVR